MSAQYNADQRREYLTMSDRIGMHWVDLFRGNTEFYSSAYWDLLTELWRRSEPVRKTEAAKFMKSIKSAHTAGRYLETAMRNGILLERDNPEDARSKLVMLSPEMRRKLDAFFDAAIGELRRSSRRIEAEVGMPVRMTVGR